MKKLLLLALGVASFSACKKDSENVPAETTMITRPNWRITALTTTTTVVTSSPGSAPTTTQTVDNFAQQAACRKDDFSKFNTNQSLVVDEGATKCATADPQRVTYGWNFNSNRTQLIITPTTAAQAGTHDILELSARTMRLRRTVAVAAGNTTTTTVTATTYTAF